MRDPLQPFFWGLKELIRIDDGGAFARGKRKELPEEIVIRNRAAELNLGTKELDIYAICAEYPLRM
jgi:hypothetical protein